jgi:hypothetical protein
MSNTGATMSGTHLIEPHDLDVFLLQQPEVVPKLPVGIVPEDDAVALLFEDAFERIVDLVQVAYWVVTRCG